MELSWVEIYRFCKEFRESHQSREATWLAGKIMNMVSHYAEAVKSKAKHSIYDDDSKETVLTHVNPDRLTLGHIFPY